MGYITCDIARERCSTIWGYGVVDYTFPGGKHICNVYYITKKMRYPRTRMIVPGIQGIRICKLVFTCFLHLLQIKHHPNRKGVYTGTSYILWEQAPVRFVYFCITYFKVC